MLLSPIIWLIMLVGCTTPLSLTECQSATCRELWVEARWKEDPQAAKAAVMAVVDPVVQLSLVLQLTEAHPGEVGELCGILPPGDARVRCQSIEARPHLSDPKQSSDRGTASSWRRVFGELPEVELPDAWQGIRAVAVTCAPGGTEAACRTERAKFAAREGEVARARAVCAGLAAGTWRDECIFQAAEVMAVPQEGRHRDATRFRQAAEMCLAAGPFAHRCLTHLQRELERLATPANRAHSQNWVQLGELIAGMEQGLTALPEAHRAWVVERAWSGAIHQSMSKADRVSGALLDFLPAERHVHVRDAATWRLMEIDREGRRPSREPRSLEQWITRVRIHLTHPPQGWGVKVERDARKVGDLWDPGIAEELGIPQGPYLGGSRRARHGDPILDAQIAVLEAAAQLLSGPDLEALLVEGAASPDELVRWTAVRLWQKKLLRRLPPGLDQDSSALIRARISCSECPGAR
jgi:hypothetical protein